MAIGADQLRAIDELLATAAADFSILESLRRIAPGLSATRCVAADMRDETPFRSYERCNLYLLDRRDHCARITDDPGAATGVIVAANEQPSGASSG